MLISLVAEPELSIVHCLSFIKLVESWPIERSETSSVAERMAFREANEQLNQYGELAEWSKAAVC